MADKKQDPIEQAVEIEIEQAGKPDLANPGSGEDFAEATAEELVDDELSLMEKALMKAEEELVTHRDAMIRMQAEMENLRKRMIRDLEKSRKFALEKIMRDILQVRDSLELGLETDSESATVELLREGQALTFKMLNKVLQDHHLELIDPVGEVFNPEIHQAMTVLPSDELEENSVVEVVQKGFKLHDRLIRPAMVVVSRKP